MISLWKDLRSYPSRWARLKKVVEDPVLTTAMERAMTRFSRGREDFLENLGDFQDWVDRCRETKEKALIHADDLWGEVKEKLETMGGHFYIAPDPESAKTYIGEVVAGSGGKVVVKGKSITSEEIALNPFLESRGLEVVETDLGERIIQLAREKPSHLIVPAIHKTKEEVAQIFSKAWGRDVPDDPFIITKELRKELRRSFLEATTGITGINVVSADVPAFFLMTNEGNGRLCSTLPKVQITLTGWEKIVENTQDAFSIFDILPGNSAGLRYSSYLSIFTAPFSWRKGRSWHVVVLDNGRRKAMKDPVLQEALRCIRCGACLNVCPIYKTVGGQTFSHVYMGGIGAAWTAITGKPEDALEVASLCAGCGTCLEVCPMGIPIPSLVEHVRSMSSQMGKTEQLAIKIVSNRKYLESVTGLVNLMGPRKIKKLPGAASAITQSRVLEGPQIPSFHAWAVCKGLDKSVEGTPVLHAGCLVNYFYPEIGEHAVKLLKHLGLSIRIMNEECCGIPAKIGGYKQLWEKLVYKNMARLPKDAPLIFLCATCLSGFQSYRDTRMELPAFYDLSQFILHNLRGEHFRGVCEEKVAFHHPCHLEKHMGIKEEPLELLSHVEGIDLVEDEEAHTCCGGAGLYGFKFPPISSKILTKKLSWLRKKEVKVLVTSCPSCIMQIRGGVEKAGLPIKVVHLATFLLKAYRSYEDRKTENQRSI